MKFYKYPSAPADNLLTVTDAEGEAVEAVEEAEEVGDEEYVYEYVDEPDVLEGMHILLYRDILVKEQE